MERTQIQSTFTNRVRPSWVDAETGETIHGVAFEVVARTGDGAHMCVSGLLS